MKMPGAPYELCSVDVWDTLLRRRCHPDAVKLHVANLLLERAFEAVAESLREPRALLKARLAAEAECARRSKAQGHDDEYTHAEVLNAWLARAAPKMPAAARDALAADLMLEEWRQEEFVCYADPGIEEALAKLQARRWVFISDFYMSAERLFALLQARGLGERFADGYSSCDARRNKRSGRLFQHVQAACHVAPAQHLHVGDREVPDVRVPRKLGMPALLYRNPAQAPLVRARARWLQSRPALFAVLQKRCEALGENVRDEPYRHGLALAPLLAGFAQFIHEQARRDGVTRLLFCTREGALFARASEVLRRAAPHRHAQVPAPELLEVSREATFAASLVAAPEEALQSLARAFPQRGVEALREEFGSPEAARQGRAALLAYLRARKLPEQGRIGVVDIGWRGSILDNLARALPTVDWRGYYLGLQEFLAAQPANVHKRAFGPDLNLSGAGAKLFRDLPLLELMCGAPGGSVRGYRAADNGAIEVQRQPDPAEDAAFAGAIRDFQAGAMAGVEVWADAIHTQALSAMELRAPALAAWGRLVSSPPRWLVRLRASHKHDERFGRGRFEKLGPRRTWLSRLFSRARAGRASTS